MILDRLMLRMWAGPFVAGLSLVLGVLVLGRALKLLGDVSSNPEAWTMIGQLLLTTLPYFLLLTVPMAFFLSMQNTIASLQQSSEMDALRAAGVSYIRMFRSLLLVSVLLFVGLLHVSMVLLPKGQLQFNNLMLKVLTMKGSPSFSPQRFTHALDEITIYVDGQEEDGLYRGVILEDHRAGIPVLYTAKAASFSSEGDRLTLKMMDGVRLEGKGEQQRVLAFEVYRVSIPMPSSRFRQQHEGDHVLLMPPAMLWDRASKTSDAEAWAEWNRRILLPSMVLVLALFALPFSLSQKRSGKAGSLIAGIALLILLYNLQLLLHRQVLQQVLPTWTMWGGQVLVLGLAAFLWFRAEQDRLPALFTNISEIFYLVHQRLMALLSRRLGHPQG
ncbi:MAG: YjgP/YjgQ family permease [Caldilineae bacterium]|nr:MAG: YjgP/YjgQ family permease [Caldilineae bacterium]